MNIRAVLEALEDLKDNMERILQEEDLALDDKLKDLEDLVQTEGTPELGKHWNQIIKKASKSVSAEFSVFYEKLKQAITLLNNNDPIKVKSP